MNKPGNHDRIEKEILESIEVAKRDNIPGLICFSGNRNEGQSDEEGIEECVKCFNRVKGAAEKAARSWMNVTMRLPDEELEGKFVADAKKEGILGIKGHRSVGGIRFSIYNAVTLADIQKTVDFMDKFRKSA